MKIYTRTGDDGTTGLFGGNRVQKCHPRMDAIGTVDETNALIGAALALTPPADAMASLLLSIQHDLFALGADLATPLSSRASISRVHHRHVARLETAIDTHEAVLPPLKNFILPGGLPAAAMLHVARTACRRAERALVAAREHEAFNDHALQYLNRLSDLLFVLARWINQSGGMKDQAWIQADDSSGQSGSDEVHTLL